MRESGKSVVQIILTCRGFIEGRSCHTFSIIVLTFSQRSGGELRMSIFSSLQFSELVCSLPSYASVYSW